MIAAVTTEDKFIELKLPVRNMFFSPYLLKIMQKSSVLLLYFIINLELSPRKKKHFLSPPTDSCLTASPWCIVSSAESLNIDKYLLEDLTDY